MKKEENAENFGEIKIFSSDDEKLKILGELLSNKSSRDIIKLLIDKEYYINEISDKLGLRVNLVIHHLKKMEELGILLITEKKIVKKGINHRYFRINPYFFVIPKESKDEVKSNDTLKKFFKDGIKFSIVVFTGLLTWFGINSHNEKIIIREFIEMTENTNYSDFANNPINGTSITIVESIPNSDIIIPLIIAGSVLFLIWFSKKIKN